MSVRDSDNNFDLRWSRTPVRTDSNLEVIQGFGLILLSVNLCVNGIAIIFIIFLLLPIESPSPWFKVPPHVVNPMWQLVSGLRNINKVIVLDY